MSRTLNDIYNRIAGRTPPEHRSPCRNTSGAGNPAQLRKALGLSQKDLAGLMHITQPAVSKLERQTDMQLSTLAGIVEAMGGTLEITARFPDRGPVRLA